MDVRIIAATNKNLEQAILEEKFREDLYFRLKVVTIELPQLKDRPEDINGLVAYFMIKFSNELKVGNPGIGKAALAILNSYAWPGNIRELRNLIEREIIFSKENWLSLPDLCRQTENQISEPEHKLISLKEMEKQYIQKVLEKTSNNKSKAAKILGISRTTLRGKID